MSVLLFRRWLSFLLASLTLALPAAAAPAPAASAESSLPEIERAAQHFSRGEPLPAWADLLPLAAIPAGSGRQALSIRLSDTQLHVGPLPRQLIHRVVQVNEASALAAIGRIEQVFNPQFQTLRLHRLWIERAGEIIDRTLSAPVRFLPRAGDLKKGAASGQITVSIALPDLRVGDSLHLVWSSEGDNPLFAALYSARVEWDAAAPVALQRVSLLAPPQRQIGWRWVGGLGEGPRPQETLAGGMRRWLFTAHDLPAVDSEAATPAYVAQLRRLQFSEYRDWNEVARRSLALFPADAPLPNAMAALIARLRALEDPDEKVSQALQWMQAEIRNQSIGLGENSPRPRLPAEVVKQRSGDSRDKALLLATMLRELGVDARPALVSLATRQGPSLLLPTPDAFDHVVVQVSLAGRDFYLDPTRAGQVGPLAHLGQTLEDAVVLPLAVDSRTLVSVRSPRRSEIFHDELSERFSLERFDGPGWLEITRQFNGSTAEALRVMEQQMDARQLQEATLSAYASLYPGIRLIGEPQFSDDRRLNRITLRASFAIPRLAREVDGNWTVPFVPGNLKGSFTLPGNLHRQFPVLVPAYPETTSYSVEMAWPASVAAARDPSAQAMKTPHFELHTTRSLRGNVELRTLNFTPTVAEIPAAELPRLRADLDQLNGQIGGVLVAGEAEISSAAARPGKAAIDNRRKQLQAQIDAADQALAGGRLRGNDLAAVLCSRASARNDLGEASTAALDDARNAVQAAAGSGLAWSCLGDAEYQRGDFANAAEAYGRALPLLDETAHTHYRRGHARYFAGQPAAATDDFAQAAASNSDRAAAMYAQLWQLSTLLQLGKPLPAGLTATAAREPRGAWPRPALALFAGLLSVDEVLTEVQHKAGDERELDLAEAWFYIGQYHLAHGREAEAREAFATVLEQGVTFYVEHPAARFELQRLNAAF